MSRTRTGGDIVVIKPKSGVYTVLALSATLGVILGTVVIFMRANRLFAPYGLMDIPPEKRATK